MVAGFGTGGTITGIALALSDAGTDAKAIAVEPAESPLVTEGKAGAHGIQGIGANFLPGNFHRDAVYSVETVKSDDAVAMTKRLAREEGLFVGISAGANVVKAVELAEKHPGSKIVAIVPDGGGKYVSMGIYE